MHEGLAQYRAFLIEGGIFAVTTAATFVAAYLLAHVLLRFALRLPRPARARWQLPATWLLWGLYLLGGLLYYEALPTSPRALAYTTVLFAGLSLVLALLNRLATRRNAVRPAVADVMAAGLLPWALAWALQTMRLFP